MIKHGGGFSWSPSGGERLARNSTASGALHEMRCTIPDEAKSTLAHCRICKTDTLHTRALLMLPFRCVANHGGSTLCDCCGMYATVITKVVVSGPREYQRFCAFCAGPDSPEKQRLIEERKLQALAESKKPIDLNDPVSIARALGASSFSK